MSLYTKADNLTVYPKLKSLKQWRLRFLWVKVPSAFPLRRQWTNPRPRMEHIPGRGLIHWEKEAFDFFEASSIPTHVGKKRVPIPLIWLPYTK